jgi:hypothetical protein
MGKRPVSAALVLVDATTALGVEPALFDAMLEGWRRQHVASPRGTGPIRRSGPMRGRCRCSWGSCAIRTTAGAPNASTRSAWPRTRSVTRETPPSTSPTTKADRLGDRSPATSSKLSSTPPTPPTLRSMRPHVRRGRGGWRRLEMRRSSGSSTPGASGAPRRPCSMWVTSERTRPRTGRVRDVPGALRQGHAG